MSEEALQITEERREAKSKGERERHRKLNAEFRRMAWRGKKTSAEKGWRPWHSNGHTE